MFRVSECSLSLWPPSSGGVLAVRRHRRRVAGPRSGQPAGRSVRSYWRPPRQGGCGGSGTHSIRVASVRRRREEPGEGGGAVEEGATWFLRCVPVAHPASGSGAGADAPPAAKESRERPQALARSRRSLRESVPTCIDFGTLVRFFAGFFCRVTLVLSSTDVRSFEMPPPWFMMASVASSMNDLPVRSYLPSTPSSLIS